MKPNEVIVVDASEKLSKILVDKCVPVTIIRSPRGLTRQRNVGIQFSEGNYVAFFDDDCVLDSICIQEMLNAFRIFKTSSVGAVTGLMNPAQLTKGSMYRRLMRFLFLLGESGGNGVIKASGYPSLPSGPRPRFIECLIGGGMAFRREALLDVGGFDEQLTGYGFMEDQDIAVRLRNNGWRLLYWPQMVFYHFPAESGRVDPKSLVKMKILNSRYLLEKNFGEEAIRKAYWWWSIIGLTIFEIRSLGLGALSSVAQGVADVFRRRLPFR